MAKKNGKVVRIPMELNNLVRLIENQTAWKPAAIMRWAAMVTDAAQHGEETRLKNLIAWKKAAEQLQAKRERTEDLLQPLAAKVRSIRSLLKIQGPDIAEAPTRALTAEPKKG